MHNAANIIAVDEAVHLRISSYYSSIDPGITGSATQTIRQWLSDKSFEYQYEFGVLAIRRFGGRYP